MFHLYQAELAEEERLIKVQNRTLGQKCRLYTLRGVISIFVIILLGGAVYAIIITVQISIDPVSTYFLVQQTVCTGLYRTI